MGFFFGLVMDIKCLGNCVTCLEVNLSLFGDLNEKELELLNTGREKYYYEKGDVIFQEGTTPDGLYCLNLGKVKFVKEGKIEKEFIVGLSKPVDFLGFDNLMSNSNFTSTAIALETSAVCLIKKENLFSVISVNPQLGLKIINHLSNKLIGNSEKLLVLTQSKLESRLAFTLIELVNFFGFKADGKTLAVELKRKEIASLASMNTANVIRVLSQFKKQKIINATLRKIQILNLKELKSLID